MKALRVYNKRLFVKDVTTPKPRGEAMLRVLLSGICNTDLEIARGYAGFKGTIGHEFVGVLEEPAGHDLAGRRVVAEINAGCGRCALCRAGDPRHCAKRTVLGIVGRDGAHAEWVRVPLANLLPVPDSIPDEHAVFVEPLAAARGILEASSITEEDRVAVIGDGKLGLLCVQIMALTGARTSLVGKYATKLRIAERRGIETITVKQAAKRKQQYDVVVEASGAPAGFQLALDLLRPKGRLILKSTFHDTTEVNLARVVVDEIMIVGSRCGRFAPALDLLKNKAIDVDSLISEEYALSEGVYAMERAGAKGVLKVLLRP
ncbi:MAG: alcohol dehydrogenase catalytic domain-containing protein [Pyrinomonadaceae bacterium]